MSSCASRTTLAGMQQLWRQHAAVMDAHGKQCAEQLYAQHSQALQELAGIKQFDLKPTLVLLNTFVGGVRESVMSVFTATRQQDELFAQQLYQTTRTAFTRNLKAAMEARDAWYHEKVKALQARHQASLSASRSAAAIELQQQKSRLSGASAVAVAAANAPAVAADQACEALGYAAALQAGDVNGSGAAPDAGGIGTFARTSLPTTALVATEGGEAVTPAATEELEKKVGALQLALQDSARELASWKSKWAMESTKADGVKRECLLVVQKCEDHVTKLQQQHVAELSQRDYILQRCRDTILSLEGRLGGQGGQ